MPEKWVGHLISRWLDRITLNHRGASTHGELHRLANQVGRHSLSPVGPLNEKTGDGPYQFCIHRAENLRALQTYVVSSRRHCAPTDRFFAEVSNHPRLPALDYQVSQTALVYSALALFKLFSRHAPEHAPTSSTRSTFTEQVCNVGPTRRCCSVRFEAR